MELYLRRLTTQLANANSVKKNIKSAGNTTNLMGHIRNVHKAVYLQISQKEKEEKELKSSVLSSTNKSILESEACYFHHVKC